MTRTLLVAGTASHVGKSTVAAGLCRLLADEGVDVAPFKAQNMSNNARAVPRTDGGGFGEVGVSQYAQARAARVRPETDHNPVLLKPRGDGESQVVIDGEAVGHFPAGAYYDEAWNRAREAAAAAHRRLRATHDVVVAEGAGSIAEINLHDRDLANVETARFADADVLLVTDIDRGGAFASLVGTLELLPSDLRDRVGGALFTKFRGDPSLLDSGIGAFEGRTDVPILGVLPYDAPGLPAEDSVSLPSAHERSIRGDDDGVPASERVTVAVPRLPCISNATDLEPIARVPGVSVAYLPLSDSLADADAVVVPGTKNAADDLLALRDAGFHCRLRAFEGPIVGLCGGYQLLGDRLIDAAREGTGDANEIPGVGLLPIETRFATTKRVTATTLTLDGTGPLAGVRGRVSGYEIHAGRTRATHPIALPFSDADGPRAGLGAAAGDVLGTYLHGLFENECAREAFVDSVFAAAGVARPSVDVARPSPFDRAATLVADHADLSPLDLGV